MLYRGGLAALIAKWQPLFYDGRNLTAAAVVNATISAITTTCEIKNGGSDCVGATAFSAATF